MNVRNTKSVFLSYSHKDSGEVELFELALRRRGIPLWRDRDNLLRGRVTAHEIGKACEEAAGFVFYLSQEAARSEWVRDRELEDALSAARRNPSLGIVPVFRDDLETIRTVLDEPGTNMGLEVSNRAGAVIDPRKMKDGRMLAELDRAADDVFASFLHTLKETNPSGGVLRLGAATRGGPALRGHALDLILDWTVDFGDTQNQPPNPTQCDRFLKPALRTLCKGINKYWAGHRIRIVPHCHLSMALALGFQFGRNSGYELEVVDPYTKEVWVGPRKRQRGLPEAWDCRQFESQENENGDVVVAVCVSRAIDTVRTGIENWINHNGIEVSVSRYYEPTGGTSHNALTGRHRDEPHRMAVAIVDELDETRKRYPNSKIHFFLVGPPGFAILIGQQLPNVGAVHTYEWVTETNDYRPCFELRDS
ncbi:SAVED domain-containing protein [Sulfidibacter corallicola]|uniref:SAVED domain-containing protein n=1 Tax=Sulfidibacter corallicola TaxID=2818388 RepID=A0A8A4TLJ8_SULCO|nr:SAVED domain-containing protein [Sulfidibacter corallicola]QTD49761.1 SAVED domain-containing protein [Sulfidibacter corallicola]